jgi:hypothetical protein
VQTLHAVEEHQVTAVVAIEDAHGSELIPLARQIRGAAGSSARDGPPYKDKGPRR